VVVRSLDELQLPSASMFSTPGGRLASLIVTARTTALVPMMAVTLAGFHLLPVVALAGGAALVTTGVGGKLFRDESRRQREFRRQQAKTAAAKFVEEGGFEMNKVTRDSLRQTQRLLRDEFQARAQMMQASATGAVDAARRASALDRAAQARRSDELEEEAVRLGAVRRGLLELSGAGSTRG
jgi:hypothetical protein